MKVENKAQKKVEIVISQNPNMTNDNILYRRSIIISIFLFLIVTAYYSLAGHHFSIKMWNKSIADTSFIVIGISLILSSLCYFFNFADKYIIYRKHLGIVGFLILIIHILISILHPVYGPFPEYYLTEKRFPSFVAAVLAAIILTGMAAISNRFSIQNLGPKLWRTLLRFGFLAYILTLFHFGVKNLNLFIKYFTDTQLSLPPMSLLAFVFGIVVIAFRIMLFLKVRR
jgi:DMSO/TMAO reductase YedYZ heme-binding membrane subunit